MAKTTERLSPLKVPHLVKPGLYADGGNLYFRVAPNGTQGWIFRFAIDGRTRDMGLGAYPEISIAAARKLAAKSREKLKEGIDPIERRKAERAAQRAAASKSLTFDACARQYIADHEAAWRNAKHRAQWTSTLRTYVSPVFGKLLVADVDGDLVMRALKSIWYTKPETASRLRGRIESVLDWARVNGYRSGENPARWKGNLDHLLPARSKVKRVTHLPALPYTEIGAFIADLRQRQDLTARALEFVILTATRTKEALGATWAREIDLPGRTWIVPADRMKIGNQHRIPLSSAAMRVLESSARDTIQRFCISWRQTRPATFRHGATDAPAPDGPRGYCARVSIDF